MKNDSLQRRERSELKGLGLAVRASCGNCKNSFTAPEDYIGTKIRCPKCQSRVRILSEEDRLDQARQDEEAQEWHDEQQTRIRLFESMAGKKQSGASERNASYAIEFGTGVDKVRNFHAGAVTRFRKLRALSRFLLLSAYLLAAFSLCGIGVTFGLYFESVIQSPLILCLCLLGWAMILTACFCGFKFLGEMSWLLADLGDHQLDVRNLMMDLREDYEREQKLKSARSKPPSRARPPMNTSAN